MEKKKITILKNILIKEKINEEQSQIIVAESGEIIGYENFQKKLFYIKEKL